MTRSDLTELKEFTEDLINKTRTETRAECFKVMGDALGLDLGNPEDVKRLRSIVLFGEKQLDMNEKITSQTIKITVGMLVISVLGYIGNLVYNNLFGN